MLSEGAIQDIITKPADQHPQKPLFQILGIKKIQTRGNYGAGSDRYRLVLSDGINLYTSAMLGIQLNDLVLSKQIEAKAVVQLDKYVCNTIQETRKVLIVLEVTVIKPGSEVPGRIGNPKNINDNSNSDRQPQQNGTSGQHSMSGGTLVSGGPVGGASRGAGLASATYGRWTIRARVTSKSNIRTWSNSKGEGRVFNVDLVDESGEIRATGFNDAVDKFYEMLDVNKVFYISKCSLRTANKQYSSLKNDYEMYLNNDSIIEPCNDACNLPTIPYNFIQIADLANFNADSLVENPGLKSYKRSGSYPRGICVILNNVSFRNEACHRDGAEHDEKCLKQLFDEIGFAASIRKNLSREEIYKMSKDTAACDHSKFDTFVFIIMSHGGVGDSVCGVDGRSASIQEIMSEFKAINCPTLRNKPKLFFMQCCRGSTAEFISPAISCHVDRLVTDSTLARSACPQEADFLLAFASAPGYVSYRYPKGSVFIQVLVDVIRAHRHDSHLTEILTVVTRQVTEQGTTSTANDPIPRVQVPAWSSTLRANVVL